MEAEKQLALRPWVIDDAQELYALASDVEVAGGAGFPPHGDVAESRRVLKEILIADFSFAIVEAASGRIVGSISAFVPRGEDLRAAAEVEVGYWIGHSCWGKGYATAALGLLLGEIGKLPEVRRVTARCREANVASRRVLEKSGFALVSQPEGTCRYARALRP